MHALPDTYKHALAALKAQATAGAALLPPVAPDVAREQRAALGDAHRRMREVSRECSHIFALLLRSGDPELTLETLTEDRLAGLLGSRQQPRMQGTPS